ncbi:MAG: GYD domain-containing protein [Pseudolabrys sp.]|jgi:uncharacterized protein with GYD domain
MIRLVTRGRFTRDYAKGLIAAPEDREPVVRKLIEGAGGKLVNFYFTTGDADFLLITETNEAESAIAAKLVGPWSNYLNGEVYPKGAVADMPFQPIPSNVA